MFPLQIVLVPIIIGQNGGWSMLPKPRYPAKPNSPPPLAPRQPIPDTTARQALAEARRIMSQRRAAQQHEQRV
jgi:hypothetical protein